MYSNYHENIQNEFYSKSEKKKEYAIIFAQNILFKNDALLYTYKKDKTE